MPSDHSLFKNPHSAQKTENAFENIEVHSLDADGCFLPVFSEKIRAYKTMAAHNTSFSKQQLDKHSDPKKKPSKTIFMVGSARQNMLRDFLLNSEYQGSFVTNSIFHAITEFVDHLNSTLQTQGNFDPNTITIDKLLLDDIWFDQESGETFQTALDTYATKWAVELKEAFPIVLSKNSFTNPTHLKNLTFRINQITALIQTKKPPASEPHYFSEEPGKFALLYAQIHHVATRYPSKHLDFHFYDDSLDILYPLIAIFSHHQNLIPKHMTLHFHHYKNGKQMRMTDNICRDVTYSIVGTDVIDECYRTTVKDLLKTMPIILERVTKEPMHIGNPSDTLFHITIPEISKENYLDISKEVQVVPTPVYNAFMKARDSRLWDDLGEEVTLPSGKTEVTQGSSSTGSITSRLSSSFSATSVIISLIKPFGY